MEPVTFQRTGSGNRVSAGVYSQLVILTLAVATLRSLTVKVSLRGRATGMNSKHRLGGGVSVYNTVHIIAVRRSMPLRL
jgi:hypothetical protein